MERVPREHRESTEMKSEIKIEKTKLTEIEPVNDWQSKSTI